MLRSGDCSISENSPSPPDSQSESSPLPNKEQALAFLRFLDPEATKFTYQIFDDNADRKSPSLVRVLHGSLAEHWDSLVALSLAGAGIFVTINKTDLRGRKASNIVRVRALFVDLDGAQLSNLWNVPLDLGWVTRTSVGRFHAYWRVDGIALREFRDLQKIIIALTGGDPVVHDLPRAMRLAGFPNLKKAPSLVEGLPADGGTAVNGRGACLAILPPPRPPAPPWIPSVHFGGGSGVNRRYALAALEKEACYVEIARHGERNHMLNKAAFAVGTLIATGDISVAEIESVLTNAALNAGLHPGEISTTIRSGLTAGMANPRRNGGGG